MKTNEVLVIALVAIFAFAGAFVASYMVPAASAFNQPSENGLGPYRDYTMKVAPIEQTVVTEGTLFVKMQCGHNLFSDKIVIQEIVKTNPGYAIGNGDRVAADTVETNFAKVGGEREFAIRADGTFDTQIPEGTYAVKLLDGNGGQPETIIVTIKPAQSVTASFLGHAVSGLEEAKMRIVTITSAFYGKIIKIVDQPAFGGSPAVTHTVYHAAVPGTPATPDTYTIVTSGSFTGYAKPVNSHSPHDFMIGGQKYQIVGHSDPQTVKYKFVAGTPAIPGHAAYTETVIDVPAQPATPEVSHFEGSIVDVTAQVQKAADEGVFTFTFNNAKNPGGIFSGDDLVVQINDPAVGIVKDVVINYDGQTIETQEYQTINL